MGNDVGKRGRMTPPIEIDLNCDLGEGEPWETTRSLLDSVTSANLACGGHAGDAAVMRAVVREARARGVAIGAHPGHAEGFGRGPTAITPDGLRTLLEIQVGALGAIAKDEGATLSHLKLHGTLYHQGNRERGLAEATLRFVAREMPGAVVFGAPEGWLDRLGAGFGVEVWREGFLDRGYLDDGTLVPRGGAGAMLGDARAVIERASEWLATGEVRTVTGGRIRVPARTWCVHGDTAGAGEMAACARRAFFGTARA